MTTHFDPNQIEHFNKLAHGWWDKEGELKTLHAINPLRLDYIESRMALKGKHILDVGCGGGILSEGLAERGAIVTGIDASANVIQVAKMHLYESGLSIDYQHTTAEVFAENHAGEFDAVTCFELLEHVPDPISVIKACKQLVKPGGDLFFSTINRNIKSFAFMIVGAEYFLKIVPKGTHQYKAFIKPSELARICRENEISVQDITGLTYNPFSKVYKLGKDIDVNYFMHANNI